MHEKTLPHILETKSHIYAYVFIVTPRAVGHLGMDYACIAKSPMLLPLNVC